MRGSPAVCASNPDTSRCWCQCRGHPSVPNARDARAGHRCERLVGVGAAHHVARGEGDRRLGEAVEIRNLGECNLVLILVHGLHQARPQHRGRRDQAVERSAQPDRFVFGINQHVTCHAVESKRPVPEHDQGSFHRTGRRTSALNWLSQLNSVRLVSRKCLILLRAALFQTGYIPTGTPIIDPVLRGRRRIAILGVTG